MNQKKLDFSDHKTIRDVRLWQEQDMQQTTTEDNGNHIKRDCKTLTHCTYCKKIGHQRETCWAKDRSKKPRRFGGPAPNTRINKDIEEEMEVCKWCGKGHRMEDCTSTEEELTTELTRKILGSDWDKAEPRRKEQS